MKIDSAKQIDSLLKVLRKQGVTHYKTPDLEMTIAPLPVKRSRSSVLDEIFPEANIQIPQYNGEQPEQPAPQAAASNEPDKIETPDALTEEQLLEWSVRSEAGTEEQAQ